MYCVTELLTTFYIAHAIYIFLLAAHAAKISYAGCLHSTINSPPMMIQAKGCARVPDGWVVRMRVPRSWNLWDIMCQMFAFNHIFHPMMADQLVVFKWVITEIPSYILSLYLHQSDLITNASLSLLNHKCYLAFLNPKSIFMFYNLQHVLCKVFLPGVLVLFLTISYNRKQIYLWPDCCSLHSLSRLKNMANERLMLQMINHIISAVHSLFMFEN